MSAKVEMEIGELEADDAAIFMAELGLRESSLDRVIRLSYRLLGLISFFTAGPDETRAGRSRTAPRPSTPPARSIPTWPAGSSAQRS